jgi:arabinose-5-phosphate isomerase
MNDTSKAKAAPGPEAGLETGQGAADIGSARRVLALEKDGVDAIARALDGPLGAAFSQALDRVEAVTGRVIVTGMGKSGHVARKIAATLASVGTPSHFVHPGEASHGDLGMVARDDAVLALSNSGETPELNDFIAYCSRFTIPLISMTGREASALAEASDVALVLPPVPEACPLGLAPTTSTTMMLALGDALAVALLERKGFSAEDFQVLHPGGKLGRTLLRVSDIMHQGDAMPVVAPDMPMSEALIVMSAKRHGCVGVVDRDGALMGIVTDGDLRRHMGADLVHRPAAEIMTAAPLTIRPEALAAEALGLMNARKITALFAVHGGKPVGFLHVHDCLQAGVA